MKVTKAVFKRLLKECILELQAEGKLGGTEVSSTEHLQSQRSLGEAAQTPVSPWGGRGPIQPNLLKMALEDTMAHEVHRHREIPGGLSMPMPTQVSPRTMGGSPPGPQGSPVQPQQFPPTQSLLTEDGGANPMAFPGANKWATLAFAKRKSGNLS